MIIDILVLFFALSASLTFIYAAILGYKMHKKPKRVIKLRNCKVYSVGENPDEVVKRMEQIKKELFE